MMDSNIIKELSLIVTDCLNDKIAFKDYRKKINAILHNKSISTVFGELNTYNQNHKKEKNISTIIVTMALYMRDLDAQEIIKNEIIKFNMAGMLYGGLCKMLCGDSSIFKKDADLGDNSFNNKYEFLNRHLAYSELRLTVLLKTVETLHIVDKFKFDLLAYSDKTKLILLSMAGFRLNVKPSDELLVRLITDGDDLNQNIALYFITVKLNILLNQYYNVKEKLADKRKRMKELDCELDKINGFISQCDSKTRVSLLFNYFLQHHRSYPVYFARILVDKEHQEYFCEQIKSSGKIRSLRELEIVANLIAITPSLDDRKKRVSKSSLYSAITDVIIKFIDERKGIYMWDNGQNEYFLNVCKNLPKSCLRRIFSFAKKKQSILMCGPLDEMVRFKIFLDDNRQNEIIQGILNVINPLIE